MKTILYLTDLYYQANGREYFREDLFITEKLLPHFNVLIGHPQQALSYLHKSDLIIFRNTGPVMGYQAYFNNFKNEVVKHSVKTFNSLDGKADMQGKQYLVDLTRQGYPVIPTIEELSDLNYLGSPEQYMVKLKNGADSIGMQRVNKKDLPTLDMEGRLLQPFIDFIYEVSFYYLNNTFQYALYAPDTFKRWQLVPYNANAEDIQFAETFIQWNDMKHGITRVDACRLQDGSLLLVELEDLNPFLSLDVLPEETRNTFILDFIAALKELIY
jgi:hypothetical protein